MRRPSLRAVARGVVVALLVACCGGPATQAKELRSLRVLYVGDAATERGRAMEAFLRPQVAAYAAAERRGFEPASANGYDVVVLDWPQTGEDLKNVVSPLGAREAWDRPTVLLGSAGLNLAVAWKLKGGVGCTCLQPQAYGLREHEIFDGPFRIDRDKTVAIPTPEAFREEIKEPKIRIVPLTDQWLRDNWRAGWCSYDYDFATHPDVEYFCGGVNEKTPTAAALWRQGNLLHFGFEQSPAEMNDVGRHLLLNAIAYISRFSEDRPIAVTPSVFAGKAAPSRERVVRWLRRSDYPLEWTLVMLSPKLKEQLKGKDRAELVAWAEAESKWLHPLADQSLDFDEDLRALGVTFERPEFLDAVVRLLGGSAEERERGRRLAARYVPDLREPAAWWVAENRPYLFASDTADYRWYVDPLAKRRGVPSAELRGPKRADQAAGRAGPGK